MVTNTKDYVMTDGVSSEDSRYPLSATELRAVFNSVNDAIFVHDADGQILDVNQAAAEIYGYSREALRSGTVETTSSGVDPFTQANAEKHLKRAAEGEDQTFEWQGKDSEGNVFWEEVSLSRTMVDGEVRVLAIARDIDARKEAERRFELLIDNLPGIVYRCRNESGWPMAYVGGQAEELTGYSTDTLEAGDVSWGADVIHPDDRERVETEVEEAVTAAEPFELEYKIRTTDDHDRWVWERGQLVDVPQKPSQFLEGFITDITERKVYEQQLEQQRSDLDVLNSVLRHDVRNDLQLVVAYAELLTDQLSDPELREYATDIQESADRAVELTKTARDTAEMMLMTEEDYHERNLGDVLTDVIEELQSAHDTAVITVANSLPAVRVLDSGLLESVFRNLLENAIVHNDKDVPEVTVSVTADDETVVVSVADNGPGIPDEQKEAIFAEGEKGLDSEGTGLGLYLVKNVVRMHDGTVWVENS